MDYGQGKRISILNNDDNPSFAVPRSSPKARGSILSGERHPSRLSSILPENDAPRKQLLAEPPATFGCTFSHGAQTSSFQSHPPCPQSTLGGPGDMRAHKPSKKNKYPCPYATSHSCSATFTTSGHAARHGKTHTGEKSVHCPVCNKAFTRKDNMKQHQRTHRTIDRENSPSSQHGKWSENDWPKAPTARTESYTFSQTNIESSLTSPISRPTSWSSGSMNHLRADPSNYEF
ncbi:predicted protein [Uncinocarpus reesii 1704]|uniref:C2H2 type master regulator of conidiophore development brlA n=1 Tax=Uncinocarpus reesii (strain UAMH 1704) TaxID=336963 RepID=C4JQU9_UNCRE|nr:uncharacterized protein UREG_03431 [Uncinocarpus reesii 1704]EEP78585.1 predicted protein [Uncinocarpus reesii 1704]